MTGTHPIPHRAIAVGPPALPIARNAALLSAAVGAHSGMQQLFAAVASITLVGVLEVDGLLGLGPAIVLAAGALAGVPMGRWMDRFGRVPVLAGGFGLGAAGCGYAFVILVGRLVDRIGRTLSLAGGLLVMGIAVSGLLWVESVPATTAALFGLGLGWNLSFIAATAELADRTEPWDRGRLLGFNDLLSGASGAGLALLGGYALSTVGVSALAIGGVALVVVPALWIVRSGGPPGIGRRQSPDDGRPPPVVVAMRRQPPQVPVDRWPPPSPSHPGLRSGLFLPLFDELADPVVVARLGAEAEEAGWHGFFVWDQVRWREPVVDVADPWITLAAVAIATETIRLGPMVTPLARRRPVKVARETATLDVLSAGRLTLGVGLGSDHFACELSITGEELDDRRRARMLDESLEILAAAWSGEPVHHRGEHYTVDGMRFRPPPVQRPGVPVWVAGFYGAARPLRRAARHQGFFPVNLEHPDQLAELATRVTALRREAGIDAAQPYDIVAAIPPGRDPAPYAAVGATWWLVELPSEAASVDHVRGVIHDGPAPPTPIVPPTEAERRLAVHS